MDDFATCITKESLATEDITLPGLKKPISFQIKNQEFKKTYKGNFFYSNFSDEKFMNEVLALPASIRLFCHDEHNRIMAHAVCAQGTVGSNYQKILL